MRTRRVIRGGVLLLLAGLTLVVMLAGGFAFGQDKLCAGFPKGSPTPVAGRQFCTPIPVPTIPDTGCITDPESC